MNFHLTLQNEKLESLKGQLSYTLEALAQTDIQDWERKEYLAVKTSVVSEIKSTESLIQTIKNL